MRRPLIFFAAMIALISGGSHVFARTIPELTEEIESNKESWEAYLERGKSSHHRGHKGQLGTAIGKATGLLLMANQRCNRECLPRGFIDQRTSQKVCAFANARSNNCANKAENDCGQMALLALVVGRGVNCRSDSCSSSDPDRSSGKLGQHLARQPDRLHLAPAKDKIFAARDEEYDVSLRTSEPVVVCLQKRARHRTTTAAAHLDTLPHRKMLHFFPPTGCLSISREA
jgi:hypothetical protein